MKWKKKLIRNYYCEFYASGYDFKLYEFKKRKLQFRPF